MPKRESWIAAVTYKESGIKNHRQSMVELLEKSSAALQSEAWID
jgi:hypothetical protein